MESLYLFTTTFMENINILGSLFISYCEPKKKRKYRNKEVAVMAYGIGAVEGVEGVGCGPNFLPGIAVVVVIILLLIAMGIVF